MGYCEFLFDLNFLFLESALPLCPEFTEVSLLNASNLTALTSTQHRWLTHFHCAHLQIKIYLQGGWQLPKQRWQIPKLYLRKEECCVSQLGDIHSAVFSRSLFPESCTISLLFTACTWHQTTLPKINVIPILVKINLFFLSFKYSQYIFGGGCLYNFVYSKCFSLLISTLIFCILSSFKP